jgi:hypothetical protein
MRSIAAQWRAVNRSGRHRRDGARRRRVQGRRWVGSWVSAVLGHLDRQAVASPTRTPGATHHCAPVPGTVGLPPRRRRVRGGWRDAGPTIARRGAGGRSVTTAYAGLAPRPMQKSESLRSRRKLVEQRERNHRLVIPRRRSRRSNPESTARTLDCFAALAMTVNDFAGRYEVPRRQQQSGLRGGVFRSRQLVPLEPPGTDASLPASLVHREAGLARHPMGRTQPPCPGVSETCLAILTYRSKSRMRGPQVRFCERGAEEQSSAPTRRRVFIAGRLIGFSRRHPAGAPWRLPGRRSARSRRSVRHCRGSARAAPRRASAA